MSGIFVSNLYLLIIVICGVALVGAFADSSVESSSSSSSNSNNAVAISARVEGRLIEPENLTLDFHSWLRDVSLQLDGGAYVAFPRVDGTFEFPDVPPGSYLLDVVNPTQVFEKVRIDINSNGKLRARVWNILKPAEVKLLPYPLKLKSEGTIPFFQRREEWRITDFLMNPMVLMMVVPLLFVFIMPRLQQDDPEVRQQLQSMMNPSQNFDMSETLTRMFGANAGGGQRRAVTSGASSAAGGGSAASAGGGAGSATKRGGGSRRN